MGAEEGCRWRRREAERLGGGSLSDLRLAAIGRGFSAPFQIANWRELPGVRIVARYNRTRERAEAPAAEFSTARR